MSAKYRFMNKLRQSGFSLVELVIIIVILGILASVAVPLFGNMINASKISATKGELESLKRAIVGNPRVIAGGELVDRGYQGDVGTAPAQLVDLVTKPVAVSAYNKITRIGWNGPYIDANNGDYLKDAWGNNYIYDQSGRTLKSINGTDTITVTF
jgi:prepilin-type N-terminal cleavage/methylation domain-containing protein